ncbi:MAG: histidine phosphatase family protein [Saprospiraceae bacterium]|nr:histidine phosphatase family protein [Saprospiraceae bacterium]MBK7738712.1 histidine phosphatase family protein [Saprospiraceae bacterium]MBK7912716.1 histidine phosphatase family protein [Saprospiraceae bacterium]
MPIYKISLYLVSLTLSSFFLSCEKDPETIIKTVTVTDTLVIHKTDTLILKQYIEDSATTFILSRHTETTGIGTDPSLSALGQERATELARVLKNTKIQAVYSTNYNRTKETSSKIASNNSVSTQIYDPAKLDELVNSILNQYHNQVAYIVGHSNTTNVLLNILIGTNVYGNIPDSEYDNLYIVNVSSKGHAKVLHLKYGK